MGGARGPLQQTTLAMQNSSCYIDFPAYRLSGAP